MLDQPPQGRKVFAWLAVVGWTGIIWATIPFARTIVDFVGARWGRAVFRDGVLLLVVGGIGATLLWVVRSAHLNRRNLLWLLLVGALLAYLTLGVQASPEETIHFVEYVILGILVFRAYSYSIRDLSIYGASALWCAGIGLCDEIWQWLTPERVFDWRDVGFNALGGILSQVAVAKGFSPTYIRKGISPSALRRLCVLAAAFVAMSWACLMNTPALTGRVVCHFPRLWYLLYKTSAMSEYGYEHRVPGVGVFFSRFTLEELRQHDKRRAREVASIIDSYYDPRKYQKFLRTYTPFTDPFVHELRVHLFRRDHYLSVTPKYRGNPELYAFHNTVAWREHQFVKMHWPESLERSRYRWKPEQEEQIANRSDPNMFYVSAVSANLITSFGPRTVHAVTAVFLSILALVWIASWQMEDFS